MSLSGLSSTSEAGSAAAGTLLAGRYELLETIGRGGMATVRRAIDTVLERPVAVKLLYRSISSEPRFVQQFLTMERHIARLFHPNLVTIYDAGASDEGCYAVMEYVAGGSLRDTLNRGTRLPMAHIIRIAAQVADALQLLHSERIIHGDVKPDNILLDDEGNSKLVDFGIAHLVTTTTSMRSESLSGSVPYLAPEQLEHGRADARSDIYALGLVVYELLAGRRAFDGENWVAVAAQRLARDPTPLGQVCNGLPRSLARVVMRALARKPEDRFASAAELRRALLEVDTGAPPTPALASAQGPRMLQTGYLERRHTSPQTVVPASRAEMPDSTPGAQTVAIPRQAARSEFGLFRLLRGEHVLAVPVLATMVVVDLLLLLAILVIAQGAA